tara:strand:- start:203 stop:625 length:423 start_codon:yes stop_codon:yes gene_type:complete
MKNKNNSPLNSESGKWGQRDPGTGYSQKEKLSDRAGHSKAVSEGVKHGLPLVASALPIPIAGVISKVAPVLGRTAQAFTNTAKQYLKGRRNITTPGNAVRGHGRIQNVTSVPGRGRTTTTVGQPTTVRGGVIRNVTKTRW